MEATIGNLYDINKQAYAKEPLLTDKEIKSIKNDLLYSYPTETNAHYFMLLNKERSDYTIFHIDEYGSHDIFAEEVIGCLQDRGDIIAIEKQTNGAYECWIKRGGLVYMYALFPYDAAVIEC